MSGDEEEKRLPHLPLQVLLLLANHAGETLTKQQILDQVWQGKVVGEEVLTVAVSQIRKVLNDRSGSIIKTVSGQGYRFIATDFGFESDQHSSTGTVKWGLAAGAVLVMLFVLLWFLPPNQQGVTSASLTEPQRQQLQKSRFLITRNSQDARNEALSILTPLLIQHPQQPQVVKSYLQLHLQMAYANEISWSELAEQLIPMIDKALQTKSDADLALYLAELEFKGNWNFTAAAEAFELALVSGSEPGSSYASFAYAQFLLAQGEFERALSLTRDYIDKSPEAYSKPIVVWVYNMMQKYDLAIAELSSLEEYNSDVPEYWVSAQTTYENSNRPELAWQYFKRVLIHQGYSQEEMRSLDSEFVQSGLTGVYHWLLHVKKEKNNIGQYRPPVSWARYAAKSGDPDSALKYIEQALQQRQYEVLWLGVDPGYQSLHQNPKFVSLLESYGIPFPRASSDQNL